MDYFGVWNAVKFLNFTENGTEWLSKDEYLNAPIDDDDPEYVEQAKAERAQMAGVRFKINIDGTCYFLAPIPEGVSEEEIKEAIASGEVDIEDNSIVDARYHWEIQDGKMVVDTGARNYIDEDNPEIAWEKVEIDEEGLLEFATFKFAK